MRGRASSSYAAGRARAVRSRVVCDLVSRRGLGAVRGEIVTALGFTVLYSTILLFSFGSFRERFVQDRSFAYPRPSRARIAFWRHVVSQPINLLTQEINRLADG